MIQDKLADIIVGSDALAVSATWHQLLHDMRNLGRPGIVSSAIAAVNVAMWDLKARKALVHGHCHHKAILGLDDEKKLLSQLGVDFEVPDSGCCGMAGAFGFEEDKYDVSVKCAERVLIPEVENSDKETVIITDGFSCREQIRQLTDRQALHLAEVLYMSLNNNTGEPDAIQVKIVRKEILEEV